MAGTKAIVVRYYAVFREQRGLSQETVETAAPTAAALYEELRARHGFTLTPPLVRAAVSELLLDERVALEGLAVVVLHRALG